MREFLGILFDIIGILAIFIMTLFMFVALWEALAEKIAKTKYYAQNHVRQLNDEIAELRAKLIACEKVHQAETEKKNKQIEERDNWIKELEEKIRKLRSGEIPPQKEQEYRSEITALRNERDSARADARTWKSTYERNIGYPIEIRTGARYKNTPLQEHPSQPPESLSKEEIASAVLLSEFYDASKRADNVLEPLLFSGLREEDLCESIKGNALGRIEDSGFEIEKVYIRCSTEPTEGNVWSKFGTHIPTLMPITGKTPLFIKIRSKQKNDTYKEYYTSLSSCTCESNIHPCKHSVFLAQQIGALYYNQEKSALVLDDKIAELKKEAAIKKSKQPKKGA